MKTTTRPKHRALFQTTLVVTLVACSFACSLGCSSSDEPGGAAPGSGGIVGNGGGVGNGGATGGASGGRSASGSGSTTASGGGTGAGGGPGSGGVFGSGGSTASGGALGVGGASSTGGISGSGGVAVTGGAPSTGGVPASGGSGNGTGGTSGAVVTPAPGYLHTNRSKIVDASGKVVRITGISWFGFETSNYAPHGLWSVSLGAMLDEIKSLGYNTVRVPFSTQMFDAGSTPNGVDANQNPDLVGLKPIAILDKLIAGAKSRGLKIILDRHRPDSGGQSELWYTAQYGEDRWISDWKMLATRYKDDATVIGVDLHNEPHGKATWGGDKTTDWPSAAERAGNAVLDVNPQLLVIVEGVDTVDGKGYFWGGNLRGARARPVVLEVKDRLVYSAHDYPASIFAQPWFSDPSYPANLDAVWTDTWGYLVKEDIAPVWLGEFGTKLETDSDKKWLGSLATYITQNQLSFAYWCLNPDSGDTGGILQDDWKTVNTNKQAIVRPLLAPVIP